MYFFCLQRRFRTVCEIFKIFTHDNEEYNIEQFLFTLTDIYETRQILRNIKFKWKVTERKGLVSASENDFATSYLDIKTNDISRRLISMRLVV